MSDHHGLTALLGDYLVRQRWFSGHDLDAIEIESLEVVRDGDPRLLWILVHVEPGDDAGRCLYQLVVGGRSTEALPDFLNGKDRVTLGEHDGMLWYDALVDSELAIDVLHVVTPDEHVDVARPLVVEQTNSSVIYDERLILKLFRRIHPEPNPDVEITRRLLAHGYTHVVPEVGSLRRDDADLAVVRPYFVGALDGWHLAHTSLRDLLASRLPPEECGGDFAPDAHRLGEITGELHVALADAYGLSEADLDTWAAGFLEQLRRVDVGPAGAAVEARFARVVDLAHAGAAIRVHGDLHLAQVMQTDSGWYVLDFEGEPARPMAERLLPSSPLKDVAGMLRSFHYAARTALAEWGADVDDELAHLADAWERRATEAFLSGYDHVDRVQSLLPKDDDERAALLTAFELDKAVYEVGYERSHRPDWVDIPLSAIDRLVRGESS